MYYTLCRISKQRDEQMTSNKNRELVLPEIYRGLSVSEMEYNGGWNPLKSITDFFGDVWGGITDVGGSIWGGITDIGGTIWGGLTDLGGSIWGGVTDFFGGAWSGLIGFFGFGDDQFAQQRSGWGSQSFNNPLDQFKVGISRYISHPM